MLSACKKKTLIKLKRLLKYWLKRKALARPVMVLLVCCCFFFFPTVLHWTDCHLHGKICHWLIKSEYQWWTSKHGIAACCVSSNMLYSRTETCFHLCLWGWVPGEVPYTFPPCPTAHASLESKLSEWQWEAILVHAICAVIDFVFLMSSITE